MRASRRVRRAKALFNNTKGDRDMLRGIRKQLNPATAIAIVALVFAMTGGAFAVTGGGGGRGSGGAKGASASLGRGDGAPTLAGESKAKPKPKGSRGPAGPAGKTGPAGPAGAQGSAGPAGPQGPAGTNGTDGTNGTSVTSAAASASECGKLGGTTFTSVSGTGKVCNGVEGKKGETGAPWPAGGTLPEKATEKGAWGITYLATADKQPGFSAISFTIPLKAEPEAHYIGKEEQGGGGTEPTSPAIKEGKCSGNAENPEAAPGNLCVFATDETYLGAYLVDGRFPDGNVVGVSANGAIVAGDSAGLEEEEEPPVAGQSPKFRVVPANVTAYGAWAVTG